MTTISPASTLNLDKDMNMAQTRQTRTIHTIVIDLEDHVLGTVEEGDEVEIILASRGGHASAKKLTYRDLDRLLSDGAGFTKGRR